MKALFLAGGMENSLKPLTDELPKPMIPIMNKPLPERSMENFRKCGIRDIVISTVYKADYIEKYFGDRHWPIRYLVAETGDWLMDRQVLISPHVLYALNKKERYCLIERTDRFLSSPLQLVGICLAV